MKDAIIIGAGPGGYVAAIRLAQLGQQVAVVEAGPVGGVCLNWGCIPSKAFIYAANLLETVKAASKMGLMADNVRLDTAKLQQWKSGVVKKLTGGIEHLFKSHGIELIRGEARFTDAHTIAVRDAHGMESRHSAKHFIIATGSRSVTLPGFEPDGQQVVTSRHALSWSEWPKHLAILGGGYIGLEMGSMAAKLGSQVTVIEQSETLLPGSTEPELLQELTKQLKRQGLKLLTGERAQSLEKGPDGLRIHLQSGQTVQADALLVAVGRKPSTDGLSLDKIGVQKTEKGFVQVDSRLRTSVPHIFAIGDVAGPPLLAHKASKEGLVAAAVIAGSTEVLDVRAMPAVIFTDPKIATVGLTEADAVAAGHTVRVGKFPFAASGRAMSMNETTGFIKVVADAETDAVLGVQMIGPDVSELIAEATLAIEMGATSQDLALTVHAHPTLPESLMEAAEAVHNQAIHVFQKQLQRV
jgi:dihydrolipoamide dehydrogenase